MRELKDGIRSLVRIDFYGHVHKHYRGSEREQRCANEVLILQELEKRGCPNVPRLLEYKLDECWIKTTNCGGPAETISKKKSDSLFAELQRNYGVIHDDPEPRNITYNEVMGAFCVIDFELATLQNLESDSEI